MSSLTHAAQPSERVEVRQEANEVPCVRWVAIVALLAAIASIAGLLTPRVYRDEGIIRDGWIVNDAVTLVVAVPVLVAALHSLLRGSARARVVVAGVLHYMLYDYCFYLFGAALNVLFLLYASIVATAFWGLVGIVRGCDPSRTAFSADAPARRVAAWMLFVALGLSVTWVVQWTVALHRAAPASRFDLTPEFVRLVASLDLTMMVSLLVPGGIWLWRRRPWGFVVGGAMMVSAALYNLVLAAGSIMQARAGLAGSRSMLVLWAGLNIGCALSAVSLLRGAAEIPRVHKDAPGQGLRCIARRGQTHPIDHVD